jgi:uncharacterized protein
LAHAPLFLDTAYVYALFNTRDQWHPKAVEWQKIVEAENRPLLTTQLILVEIGNGMSGQRFRQRAAGIIGSLLSNSLVDVIPFSPGGFARAFELFEQRPDKDWGLTDCFSFITMQDNGIADALTTDDHFRQAGFTALLLD